MARFIPGTDAPLTTHCPACTAKPEREKRPYSRDAMRYFSKL